ncbi:MAG: type II and III secretion system protein, partial [Betaproteobacteria bacterium]|nr:type II and III secretion system protein [Betaproteobacteria bacterium]
LSGLLSEEGSKSLEKVSGLGDIPILGALFRSKDFRQRRSEMVVMVTPRLISPEDAFHRRIIERSSENRRQVEKRIFGREAKEQAQEGGVSND